MPADTISSADRSNSMDSVSLRDYADTRSIALRDYVDAKFTGLHSSVTSEIKRLQDVNEHVRHSNKSDKDSLEKQLMAETQAMVRQFEAVREATRIASNAMDKRLEGMNEFRAQINDAQIRFALREEVTSNQKYLSDRVAVLEAGIVTRSEQASYQTAQGNRVSVLESRITAIEASKVGAGENKREGTNSTTLVLSALGVATAIIVAAFSFIHSATPVALPQSIYQAVPVNTPHQ
jgi:hypothetical protein